MAELDELVARARGGDREAFAALVDHGRSGALAYARLLVGDVHRAEDVVQEAFVLALTRLDQLAEPAAFLGWLRTLVRTAARRLVRRRRPDLFDPAADEPPGPADDPRDEVAAGEARERVRDALAGLPDRQRALVERYYVEGRSVGEIAATLGLPEGTVKRHLHEAREGMRARLVGLCAPRARPAPRTLRRPL